MRQTGLWISPFVAPSEERIIDTADPEATSEWQRLRERDPMPSNTVLLVVHPARYREIMSDAVIAFVNRYGDYDPNHRAITAYLLRQKGVAID